LSSSYIIDHLKTELAQQMKRTTEPELMDNALQAKAYAEADFESAHSALINQFTELFPDLEVTGELLDLGCGPGDISFRFAKLFGQANITGIDGAQAMLELARMRAESESLTHRIEFKETIIPSSTIPKKPYKLIVSNSLLHHLHNPDVLWNTVLQHSNPETVLFIADLCRPQNGEKARQIVAEFAANESNLLREDFYNSLLAAFRPDEIKGQLTKAGLEHLSITQTGHHLFIYGKRAKPF